MSDQAPDAERKADNPPPPEGPASDKGQGAAERRPAVAPAPPPAVPPGPAIPPPNPPAPAAAPTPPPPPARPLAPPAPPPAVPPGMPAAPNPWATAPPPPVTPPPEQHDPVATIIPYKNGYALAAYYLAVFSIIPGLGAILGLAGLVLGIIGLKNAKRDPKIKGKTHAWVGIIAGGLFGFGWLAAIIALVVVVSHG